MSSILRKTAKTAALPAGLASRKRAGDVVVLLYHRVGLGDREIDLEVATFERQLDFLASRERVLTLDEALVSPAGGVVITVDDGYSDFYDHVFPLLVKYQVPALLYLATSLVANGEGSGADGEPLRWAQLREAAASGLVTVGAHTHSHADLSKTDERSARTEMLTCKGLIEDHLERECKHFSYPWSLANAGSERAARAIFESAALPWRTNRRGRIDPYRLGRTPILRSDTNLFFKAKVAGVLDKEALVYRIMRRGPWRP